MEPWTELGFSSTPEAAWETLIRRYAAGIEARVRRALRRAGVRPRGEQIEEIVQEVYCRLLADGSWRLRQCRATSQYQIGAFLGKVAERVALDHVRAARAQKRGGNARGRGASAAPGTPEASETASTPDAPGTLGAPGDPCRYRAHGMERNGAGGRDGYRDPGDGAGQGDGEVRQLVDPRANPEELMLGRERMRLFLERCGALAGSREARRNARILALAWNGWNSCEIARVVGGRLTPRSIDSLLRRIRRRAAAQARRRPPREGQSGEEL
jgi:DNA-directed RNA polymerase specialized sigma24 family protein